MFKNYYYFNRGKKKTNFRKSASYHFFFKLSTKNLEKFFSLFSRKMLLSWKKLLDKKIFKLFIFIVQRPFSQKWSCPPKLFFVVIFGKYWFFSEKIDKLKIFRTSFPTKKGYTDFCPRGPLLRSNQSCSPHK